MEQTFYEKLKNITESNKFKKTLYIILGIVLFLFVFQLGMFVGFKRAYFSNKIGGEYFQQMQGRNDTFITGLQLGDFINAHGAIGHIVGIKLPLIVVESSDETDETIRISSSTEIKYLKGVEAPEDLKLNDFVAVFGSPGNEPIIEAKLIRVLPSSSGK